MTRGTRLVGSLIDGEGATDVLPTHLGTPVAGAAALSPTMRHVDFLPELCALDDLDVVDHLRGPE